MFLSVHTCAGAIIGRFSPNPVVAFLLGFLSHLILDMIPHGDKKIHGDEFLSKKFFRRSLLILFLDGFLSMYLVIFILLGINRFDEQINVAAGIIGATILDVLELFYQITKIKFLKCINTLHLKAHYIFAKKKEVPYVIAIFYQLILLAVFLIFIKTF